MNNKRHKFNKLKELAYSKGYILEDCFISGGYISNPHYNYKLHILT